MKIKKEQDSVMQIHKKKDSKLHQKSDSKINSKSSALAKGKVVASEAGIAVTDNLEGAENVRASIEVGATAVKPVANTMAAGNRIRKLVADKSLKKEFTSGRTRKQASSRGKKLAMHKAKKSASNMAKKKAKNSTKKIAKKVSKETAKESAKFGSKTAAKVGGAVAGSAAGPAGTLVGYAVGKATEERIENGFCKLDRRSRMLKFFRDKLNDPSKQNDNILKLGVDLIKMRIVRIYRAVYAVLAPVVIPIVLIIVIVGGLVLGTIEALYHSPLALIMPPISKEETLQSVTAMYVDEFNEKVREIADEHKGADEGKIVYLDYEGTSETPTNAYDIMCVYMVRYGYASCAIEMNDDNKKKLKSVVDDMCKYTKQVTTKKTKNNKKTDSKTMEDGNKNKNKDDDKTSNDKDKKDNDKKNKSKLKKTKILKVKVTLKRCSDMVNVYGFDEGRVAMLNILMNYGYRSVDPNVSGASNPSNLKGSLSDKEIKAITDKINDEKQRDAVSYVLTKVGYPYSQARRNSGTAFDCSSLVYFAWKSAGIDISYGGANTAAAEAQGLRGKTVSEANLKPGDLIFYSYAQNGRYRKISHVGMYVGDGKMVEAMDESHGVVFGNYHNKSVVMIARPGKKSS